MEKQCIYNEDKVCDNCGECRCDLDPEKICDNCMQCMIGENGWRAISISGIAFEENEAEEGSQE